MKKKLYCHVCEVNSKSSLVEWDLVERLKLFFGSLGLTFQIALDTADQKCLRFSMPQELVTLENVKKIHACITSIVTDATMKWPGLSVENPDLTKPIPARTEKFEEGQKLVCINVGPLPGNDIAPALKQGKSYSAKGIILDKKGNQHLDVGLPSNNNYIRSYETGEELENGKTVHWAHPSRFILKNKKKAA